MTLTENHPSIPRWVGVFLVGLALFTAASSAYFEVQAREARECIDDKVSQLVIAVDARSKLASRSNAATQSVLETVADNLDEPPAVREATTRQALEKYVVDVSHIEADRREAVLPEYPPGECVKP